jgi:hypothetical protein
VGAGGRGVEALHGRPRPGRQERLLLLLLLIILCGGDWRKAPLLLLLLQALSFHSGKGVLPLKQG